MTRSNPLAGRVLAAVLLTAVAGSALGQPAPKSKPATKPAPAPAAQAAPAPPPKTFDQQFQEARALAESGQREEAIRAYTELLKRSPSNSDVLVGRGSVYSWMKRWPEAEADLLAATKISPTRRDAWSALGNVYYWSHRPRPAIDAYTRWIALAPKDPDAYIARGRARRDAYDLEAARGDFETARSLGANPAEMDRAVAALSPRAQPEAQVPAGYRWSALLGGNWSDWSPDRARWRDYTLSLRRHLDCGSLALERLQANHFETNDGAWALDGYTDMWERAYMNVRYQWSPSGGVLPDQAYRAELWQGVGKGWEPSVSYDRIEFSSTNVDLYGIGIGRYTGPFYLRWKHLFTHTDTSHGNSDQLLGRWYYDGTADDYLELRSGFGRGTQDSPLSGTTFNTRSTSVGIAYVRYFTPHWGYKAGFDYSDERDGFVGRSFGATLYRRW